MLKEDSEVGITITRIGNGAGPNIPAAWRNRLDIEPSDCCDAEADFENRTVTLHF